MFSIFPKKRKNKEPKLSAIIKKIAKKMLKKPKSPPSSEAAHAALLLTHLGWNRALGYPEFEYEHLLEAFGAERPSFWQELKSNDPEYLISLAEKEKLYFWPDDRRVIVVCGMRAGNVRVEWHTMNE